MPQRAVTRATAYPLQRGLSGRVAFSPTEELSIDTQPLMIGDTAAFSWWEVGGGGQESTTPTLFFLQWLRLNKKRWRHQQPKKAVTVRGVPERLPN